MQIFNSENRYILNIVGKKSIKKWRTSIENQPVLHFLYIICFYFFETCTRSVGAICSLR